MIKLIRQACFKLTTPAIHLVALFSILILANNQELRAQAVDVVITNYGTNSPEIKNIVNNFIGEMETLLSEEVPNIPDIGKYLEGTNNANSMAIKTQTPVYGGRFQRFATGISFGLATDLGNQSLSDIRNGNTNGDEVNGMAIHPTLSLSFRLGKNDPAPKPTKKVESSTHLNFDNPTVSFSQVNSKGRKIQLKKPPRPTKYRKEATRQLFHSDRSSIINIHGSFVDKKGISNRINFKNINFGVLYQRKLTPKWATPLSFLTWDGIDLIVGAQVAYFKIGLTETLKETVSRTVTLPTFGDQLVTATVEAPTTVGIQSQIISIPLELATHATFAHFLFHTIGFGVDLNFGKAQSFGESNPIIYFNSQFNVLPTVNGQIILNANQERPAKLANARFFLGTGLRQGPMVWFLNFNKSILSSLVALSMGVKFLI
jgi:hypothetical protein